MLRHNKGQSGMGLIAGVMLLVVGVAVTLVSIFIGSELVETINGTMMGDAANDSFDDVANNMWSAFTLIGIAFIAIGAAVILSILRNAF